MPTAFVSLVLFYCNVVQVTVFNTTKYGELFYRCAFNKFTALLITAALIDCDVRLYVQKKWSVSHMRACMHVHTLSV